MTTIAPSNADLQSRARPAGYEPGALEAAVLVVGVGAIGQNTAQTLALSGVREIRIVDADSFEPHNLTRSPLFPPDASDRVHGLPKAPACAAVLSRMATHPRAEVLYADAWVEELGAAAFAGVAAVVCCVDSLRARAYLAMRCRELDLPMIEAGFAGADVNVGVYPPLDDCACWRCGKEIHDEVVSCRVVAAASESLGVVPAIQAAAAVAGGLQAEAAIGVLHRVPASARRVWLDIRSGESLSATLPADPACRHRRLADPMASGVSVDMPAATLIEAAGRELERPLELELPSPYMTVGACGACAAPVEVAAPGHRYTRNPRCRDCGGPWARASATPANGVSYLAGDDPLAQLSCGELGLRPGDVVVVGGPSGEAALLLKGRASDLFSRA